MKKVLHISKYYYPFIGGVEAVARDYVNSLDSNKYEQKIICFNHEKGNKIDFVDNIEVNRLNCEFKVSSQSISLKYKKELKRIMNEFQPDVVVFHYPNPYVARFLLKYSKRNFKLVLYWHLDIVKQKILGKLFKKQNLRLLDRADKIVVTSQNYIEGSRFLQLKREKCVVIPCCVNDSRLKSNLESQELAIKIKEENKNKKICFAFGRHVEYKGLEYIIDASKYLPDDYVIFIGGKGPLTDALMEKAKGDSKIKFLGRISDVELQAYLIATDVFCFPSITRNEAFGIGLAEGMYYSNPAVTFTIPGSGVNYVNLNNVTGLEVENKNAKAYAEAIQKINNNLELKKEFGLNAKKRVEELFILKRFKENIDSLMNNL